MVNRLKFLLLAGILLLSVLPAKAAVKYYRRDDMVFGTVNGNAQPQPTGQVRVCTWPTSQQSPCLPVATTYSDETGSNPNATGIVSAQPLGNTFFFAASGHYRLEFTAPGFTEVDLDDIAIQPDPSTLTFSPNWVIATQAFATNVTFNVASTTTWFDYTLTGNSTATFSGTPVDGTEIIWNICQDSIGNHTFTWPGSVTNPITIPPDANSCTKVSLTYHSGAWRNTHGTGDSTIGNTLANIYGNARFEGPIPWVDVTLTGAVMDARQVLDGAMTSGAANLTSATASFASTDVGKTVYVQGAGPAGVPLVTTISSVTNGTTAVLGASASTNTSSAQTVIFTDNTASIQSAVTRACTNGAAIFIPAGSIGLLGPVNINDASCAGNYDKITFEGEERGATRIYGMGNGDIFRAVTTTAPSDPFKLIGINFKNFTLIGGDQPNGVGLHIGDEADINLDHLMVIQFRGANHGISNNGTGAGIWIDNTSHWTERLRISDVSVSSNSVSGQSTAIAFTTNGGTNSFGYCSIDKSHFDSGEFFIGAGVSMYNCPHIEFSGNSLNIHVAGNLFHSNTEITGEGTGNITVDNTGIFAPNHPIFNPSINVVINGGGIFAPVPIGQHTGIDSSASLFGNYKTDPTNIIAVDDFNPGVSNFHSVLGIAGSNANSRANIIGLFNTTNDGRSGVSICAGTSFSTCTMNILLDPQGNVYGQSLSLAGAAAAVPNIGSYPSANMGTFLGPVGGFTGTRIYNQPDYSYAWPTTVGNVGQVLTTQGVAPDQLSWATITTTTPVQLTRRVCEMVFGADNGGALADADIAPQTRQCFIPYAATVVEVDITSDAGTPSIVPAKNHAGVVTDLLSGALSTAAAGAPACSNTNGAVGLDGATTCSATLNTTALASGDYIQTHTGTAGGTAKRVTVSVVFTVN